MRATLSAILAALVGLLAAPVSADPLPLSANVRVGRPARPLPVRVEATPEGAQLVIGTGPRAETHALPIGAATDAAVETVELAGGASVAIVRVQGEGSAAALIGGRGQPSVLWSGRLDAHGDPGERRRGVIEVADRTGDGKPDVVVGATLESTRICGQDETLLSAQAVDPRTLELRPVELRRLTEGRDQIEVTAVADSPGPEGAPLLSALHFLTASSTAGSPEDPSLVQPPTALSDGDAQTLWREGRPGAGRWEFATGRFGAGQHRIRAFALTLAPTDDAPAREVARPHHLWLVGDRGARLRVTVPRELAREPGARVWVVPPAPLSWRCVSVVLDDAWPSPTAGAATALAEIEAYTDLDFGEGIPALVEQLVVDGDRGTEAARLLATLGAPAVDAVDEAWETLTPTGRRRSIRVFAENARTSEPAREALARAARDDDEDVRADALAALVAAGGASVGTIAALTTDPVAGEDAALALARLAPDQAVEPLLAAVTAEGGSERPALRRALRTAAQRGGDEAQAHIARWRQASPPMAAAAAAALALARAPEARTSAAELLRTGIAGAERFEDRWRLVRAAAELGSDPEVDAWLATTATGADEWMLRREAISALAAREAAAARQVARQAIDDPYPRVRVAAIEVLQDDVETVERLAVAARRDSWPMVRAAAVTALADDARALPVVRAAVGDRSRAVRAAAVRGLAAAGDRASWERVAARLEDDEEWPEVIGASIEFARTLCVRELAPPIVSVLRRGMRPNAWAPDVEVAVDAVHALAVLGGEDAAEGLEMARRDTAPGPIRDAAARAAEVQSCPPQNPL